MINFNKNNNINKNENQNNSDDNNINKLKFKLVEANKNALLSQYFGNLKKYIYYKEFIKVRNWYVNTKKWCLFSREHVKDFIDKNEFKLKLKLTKNQFNDQFNFINW